MGLPNPDFGGAAAHELGVKKFGGSLRPVPRFLTITATIQLLFDNNPRRVGWLVVNRSLQDVILNYTQSATTTAGFVCAGGGGSIYSSADEDGETTGWEIFASAAPNGALTYVCEFIRV